jgi:8-amino-7-oxononanoate synthase
VNDIIQKMEQKLKDRAQRKNLRELTIRPSLIDFFSNDYLGLSRSGALRKEIETKYRDIKDPKAGATGSRLLSGNSPEAMALEAHLASLFQAEKSLLFNSGYNANLAILSAVPQKGDTIIYDEFIHASLKDGARLSLAHHYTFRHNNMADLEKKIKKATGNIYVIVESVYSMDGDICPLPEIISICQNYKARIILDEAHSTGVSGFNGSGMATELKLHREIFARIFTFGKAIGVHGACIAGPAILINYLINFARPFIYTTALPIHTLTSIRSSFDHLQKNLHLQQVLNKKISFFKEVINKKNTSSCKIIDSKSSIQAIIVRGNEEVIRLAEKVRDHGYDVRPILSPTVKEGQERLRICLHVYNSEEEIKGLTDCIYKYLKS